MLKYLGRLKIKTLETCSALGGFLHDKMEPLFFWRVYPTLV